METRSKARGGLLSSMELGQDRRSPQSPLVRSSSESSLNLTMVYDDGTAGVVGSSRPEVRVGPNPNTRPPTSTSVARVSAAAAGDNIVREPITDYHRDGALTAVSTAVALGTVPGAVDAVAVARNPTYGKRLQNDGALNFVHFFWTTMYRSRAPESDKSANELSRIQPLIQLWTCI